MDSEGVYNWLQRRWEYARGISHPSATGTRWITFFGAIGVIGFILAAVVLSLVMSDRKDANRINDFSKRILTDYLTNKCVNCFPMANLTYELNASLTGSDADVRMQLTGSALERDQFITGLPTPCGNCENNVGYEWNVDVSKAIVDGSGISGESSATVLGSPYFLSEFGVTYDPLKIWAMVTGNVIDDTEAQDRCRGNTANSMYVVAISSDLIQNVCCEYVFCMCVHPGPREWCTRPLLSASDPLDEDRFNCLSGEMAGGCGCGLDVC